MCNFASLLLLTIVAAQGLIEVTFQDPIGIDKPNITVNVGDQIVFIVPGSTDTGHTVTQVSLADPCFFATGGFSSPMTGMDPTQDGHLTIHVINTANPIYYACLFHCSQGEVGTINASPDQYEQFVTAANASAGFDPGAADSAPDNGTEVGSGIDGAILVAIDFPAATTSSGASPTGTGSPISSDGDASAVSPAPTDIADSSSSGRRHNVPAIVGAILCISFGVGVVISLLVFCCRRARMRLAARNAWVSRLDMSLRRARHEDPALKRDDIVPPNDKQAMQ